MKRWMFLAIIMILAVSLVAQKDRDEASREVALLNAILEMDNATWQADVNWVTMLSNDELQGMLGMVEPETSREEFVFDPAQWPARGEKIVDNVTEVKNQKACGSCVAFGTTAAFEQTYWKKNSSKKLFSERYLFFCQPYAGYGCNGGWSLNGGAVAASNSSKGMVEDKSCPYFDGAYHYDCGTGCSTSAQKYTMGYENVSASNYTKVLDGGRVVIIGMQVYADFRDYKSGVYEHVNGSHLGGHCMALVGYGTTADGKHYWVIKNSWGPWGDQGYIRVRIKSEQKSKDSNIEDFGGYAFK